MDVGVWGLKQRRRNNPLGDGLHAFPSTAKPYGGEERKRALNPFPRATSPGIYAKSQSTFSHILSSRCLSLSLSHLFSVTHPSVAIITAISNSNVSLLPAFSTSPSQNVSSWYYRPT